MIEEDVDIRIAADAVIEPNVLTSIKEVVPISALQDTNSDVSSPSLGPPARPSEGIFARLEPARSPKT